MLAISLTVACLRYRYDGVILHAHPVRGESHNQRNTTREVATLPHELKIFSLQCVWHKIYFVQHFSFDAQHTSS